MFQFDKYFSDGLPWSLEKIPILVVSSIFTFTPTCRNGLKWPTSNVLQPHPSQITFSISRRPNQPKVQIQNTWSILAVYMNGVFKWNRSMVDQVIDYISREAIWDFTSWYRYNLLAKIRYFRNNKLDDYGRSGWQSRLLGTCFLLSWRVTLIRWNVGSWSKHLMDIWFSVPNQLCPKHTRRRSRFFHTSQTLNAWYVYLHSPQTFNQSANLPYMDPLGYI